MRVLESDQKIMFFNMLLSLRFPAPDVDGNQIAAFVSGSLCSTLCVLNTFYLSAATKELEDIFLVSEQTSYHHQSPRHYMSLKKVK